MKTSELQFRYSPLWACGLAALFLSVAGTHAIAKPPTDGSYSVKVQYDPRDLATEAGTEKIYRRIKGAARRACFNTMESYDARRTRHYWACYAKALEKAVDDVNSQPLTALYQHQDGKQKRPG
jgi:UrcA family protein